MNYRLLLFAIIFSFIGNFPGGYFSSVTNLPQQLIYDFVNESLATEHHFKSSTGSTNAWVSLIVATNNLGEFGGVLMSAYLADRFGRKLSVLLFAAIFLLIGSTITVIAKSANFFELLIVGRFLSGFHYGISRSIVYTYLFECCFPTDRGMLGIIGKLLAGFGMIAGQVFGFPELLGTATLWPTLLAAPGLIIAIISFFLIGIVPESPKFLYIVSENPAKARQSAKTLYGDQMSADDLITLIEQEEDMIKPVSIRQMFTDRTLRSCAFLCFILNNQRSFLGPTSLFIAFSTYIFGSIGISNATAQILTIAYSLTGEVLLFCSLGVVKKLSRRMMFFGTAWPIVAVYYLLPIFGAVTQLWAKYVCVVLLFSTDFFYGSGCGVMLHIIATEILPLEIRASAGAMGVAVSNVTTFLVRIIFFNIYSKIGTYAFLILAILNTIALVYLHFRVPETRDKRLDIIVKEVELKSYGGHRPSIIRMQLQDDYNKNYGTINNYVVLNDQNDKKPLLNYKKSLSVYSDEPF